MIPIEKVQDIIARHHELEKELSDADTTDFSKDTFRNRFYIRTEILDDIF